MSGYNRTKKTSSVTARRVQEQDDAKSQVTCRPRGAVEQVMRNISKFFSKIGPTKKPPKTAEQVAARKEERERIVLGAVGNWMGFNAPERSKPVKAKQPAR